MDKVTLNILGKTYESTKVTKDEVIDLLADVITQMHRADAVRTSGSEFKHKIRLITKEARLSIQSLMFDDTTV